PRYTGRDLRKRRSPPIAIWPVRSQRRGDQGRALARGRRTIPARGADGTLQCGGARQTDSPHRPVGNGDSGSLLGHHTIGEGKKRNFFVASGAGAGRGLNVFANTKTRSLTSFGMTTHLWCHSER